MKNITKLNTISKIKTLKSHFCFKNFTESKKEELEKIKASLNQERKGMLEKISEYLSFNKTYVVDHTKRDLNVKDIEKEINNVKNLEKQLHNRINKEDMTNLDELFKFHSQIMSTSKFNEDNIERISEKLKEIKNIENLFNDKRYAMFKDDIIFILNSATDPKVVCKLLNIGFLFLKQDKYMDGKSFKEFSETLGLKVFNLLEETELEELLIFCNFFHSTKDVDSFSMAKLSEPFRTEIYRRLEKEYYLKTRMKNPFIENDEILKILLVFENTNLLDEWLIEKIFTYIHDGIDNFSIKDLIEISLFFVDKKDYTKIFLNFFNKINERKLRRNIRVMSVELLYEYLFLYNKLTKIGSYDIVPVLEKVFETLLTNDSINKELINYFLFKKSSTKLITKFTTFIENIYTEVKESNKNLDSQIQKFLSLVSEYFMLNVKNFSIDDTITLINMLSSKNLIDSDILAQMSSNFISGLNTMDDSSFSKLINFYIVNSGLEVTPRFLKELKKIMTETSSMKVLIDLLFLFVRRRFDDTINEETLSIIQNKFNTIKNLTGEESFKANFNIKNIICLIWSISYFSMKVNNLEDNFLLDSFKILKLKLEDVNGQINLFELTLFLHACRNFGRKLDNNLQEKLNEILILLENEVSKNLTNLTLIEFLTVFNVYTSRNICSKNLLNLFYEIIAKSIDQFGLVHLDVLISGLEHVRAQKIERAKIPSEDSKSVAEKKIDETFLIDALSRIKIRLEIKNMEKSVEGISDNLIKEAINEFIRKEKMENKNNKTEVFRKLI